MELGDALIHVFKALPLVDVASCMRVCKDWSEMLDDDLFWRTRFGIDFPQAEILETIPLRIQYRDARFVGEFDPVYCCPEIGVTDKRRATIANYVNNYRRVMLKGARKTGSLHVSVRLHLLVTVPSSFTFS
jgi:hypothetical protein